jgi:lipopolysaccharide biosynthesis regulator YciM
MSEQQYENTIAELECALSTREMEAKEYNQIIDSLAATIAELREAAREAVDAVRFQKPEHERAAIDALAALLEGE